MISKTCHRCHGQPGDHEQVNLKRCARCRKVYYCSTTCQKADWVEHIFDCKPCRLINSADYLARAVHQNIPPEHHQTCEDYGFNRALAPQERTNLFRLYICIYVYSFVHESFLNVYAGLIKGLAISPKTIHDWRVRGLLVCGIKAAFSQIPEQHRGPYFTWFLQNEHIIALAGQPLPMETYYDEVHAMMIRTWIFIGGSERESPEEISAAIKSKSPAEKDCWFMYTLLVSKQRPFSDLNHWVDFGFAACTSPREEMALCILYQKLIAMCTFAEFCEAYLSGRLLDLLRSKELQPSDHHDQFQDLLQSPPHYKKSVWYLKQFIVQDTSLEEELELHPALTVDFGFVNCKDDSERRQLWRVYKAFFEKHRGDPLALQKAAMEGNIHGYLLKVVQGLRDPKFQRLMKNPHPMRGNPGCPVIPMHCFVPGNKLTRLFPYPFQIPL